MKLVRPELVNYSLAMYITIERLNAFREVLSLVIHKLPSSGETRPASNRAHLKMCSK